MMRCNSKPRYSFFLIDVAQDREASVARACFVSQQPCYNPQMSERYAPETFETKWQEYWDKNQTFRTVEPGNRPKSYILDMFPYPSGVGLHVGHPEGYTATDILARFRRAQGYEVLHPMGWDAFGLPAEQHAIRTGAHPRDTTVANIGNFRRQLKMLGFSYDWKREIDTTDPAYVRWTQWIFLQLFRKGLAYQDHIDVNWCPALGTVLANEEVTDGRSEIGNHPVKRMPLRQWILRITQYADRLLDGLADVTWPDSTRTMQEEWIGRSEGAEVIFELSGAPDDQVRVFTTRPDTLFGATFLVLAPEHAAVSAITTEAQKSEVESYAKAARNKSDLARKSAKEKSGVFTGAYAVNPVNGERVPVWIADYVLMGYGTGAIMAVPGHDARDFEFAKTYSIPIIRVVAQTADEASDSPLSEAFAGAGFSVNSGVYSGLSTADCKERIVSDLQERNQAKATIQYKLRDWVFSRQRYWGEPFPIYFPVACEGDPRKGDEHTIDYSSPIAVEESDLPLRLPDLEDYKPGDDPAGCLARAVDWRFFQKGGQWFARETNVMPQWAGSCWYYLRFIDPHNENAGWDPEKLATWLPVDLYMGGSEHAVLHLLYARFWHQFLYDEGLVPCPEPFTRLVHQGLIMGEVEYTCFEREDGSPVSLELVKSEEGVFIDTQSGAPVTTKALQESDCVKGANGGWTLKSHPEIQIEARAYKMSKSRGNVVNPDDIVADFGADTLRVYEMFMGPLEASKPWSTNAIHGSRRFLDRCFTLGRRADADAPLEGELARTVHRTIKTVTDHIERLRMNTAISAMMVLVNELTRAKAVPQAGVEALALLVHPFAPHLGEEMWEMLGHPPSIQNVDWPTFDEALCEVLNIELPVQVNGKVRAKLQMAKGTSEEEALRVAREHENILGYLADGELRKVIYVPDRILNLIIK